MPTVNLGRVQPIYRGYYNAATAYEPLDFVTYDGNTYFCILNSTGNTPVSGTYWQAMTSGGLADFGVTATPAELNILDGATLTTAQLNSISQLSGRNLAINGGFTVNQDNRSGTVTLAAGVYGHSMWKAGAAGCTYTFATSGGVTTLTITAGSLLQIVEGSNIPTAGYVLSWSGTAQGRFNAGTYSTTGVTASLTGAANASIEFGIGTLSKVKLESGSAATPFADYDYRAEQARCEYYYRIMQVSARGQFSAAGQQLSVPFSWPTMRVTPSYTASGGTLSGLSLAAIEIGSNNSGRFEIVSSVAGNSYYINRIIALDARL